MIRFRKTSISWMLALVPGTASAREVVNGATVNVVVEFHAPVGCSDRETFAIGLRSRSARIQITESSDRGWVVGVRLTPKDRGIHGELRLTDEHGEAELRAVDGVDCAEVVEALAFTAALAIERTVELTATDVTATTTSTGTPTAAAASETTATQPPPSAAIPPARNEANPPSPPASVLADTWQDTTYAGLIGFATKRVSPQTSFGLSLVLARKFALTAGWAAEVALGAHYVPGDTLQSKSEVRVSFVGATVQGCPATWVVTPVLTVSPCAALELARLSVSDRAVDVSLPSKRLTGFVGGLGRGRWRVARHVELALELGILTPLARRTYLANSPGTEVGHSASVAWHLGTGWLFGW